MQHALTDPNQLDPAGTYTVTDYLSWQFDELVELIKGKLVRMSPAPVLTHAICIEKIEYRLYQVLDRSKKCRAFHTMDVYLNGKEGSKPTILQPDLFIGCNTEWLQHRGYFGPPEWVCEVISPSSAKYDIGLKKQAYEEAGVSEYMVVYPTEKFADMYVLKENGTYGLPTTLEEGSPAWQVTSLHEVSFGWGDLFE
jgi:Uma2 family endonuclease